MVQRFYSLGVDVFQRQISFPSAGKHHTAGKAVKALQEIPLMKGVALLQSVMLAGGREAKQIFVAELINYVQSKRQVN